MSVDTSKIHVPDGTRVSMTDQELVFGETIFLARSSNDVFDDPAALHQRIEEDGYLVIRNFHRRDLVLNARREIVEHMASQDLLDPGMPLDDAVVGPGVSRPFRPKDSIVRQWPSFLEVVEGRDTWPVTSAFWVARPSRWTTSGCAASPGPEYRRPLRCGLYGRRNEEPLYDVERSGRCLFGYGPPRLLSRVSQDPETQRYLWGG